MRLIIIIVLLTTLACGSGCAAVGTYFKDRALDFADCFKAEVGYGFGISTHFTATDLCSCCVGFSASDMVGFYGRDSYSSAVNILAGFPLFGHALWIGSGLESDSKDKKYVKGVLFITADIKRGDKLTLFDIPMHASGQFEEPIKGFDFEIGLFVGLAGASIGFSGGQFVDFLLGWFGIDIGEDDTASIATRKKTETENKAERKQ